MSQVCDICGKHTVAGRSVSHSQRHVIRSFRPNIQRVTLLVDGRPQKKNVCTRCLNKGDLVRA